MTNVFSCTTSREALLLLTEHLALLIRRKKGEPFYLALSGGDTAQLLFKLWAEQFAEKTAWGTVRFYWVDERCVPPGNCESNFGHAHELLFSKLSIPPGHIHRIRGEADPEAEAERYGAEVEQELPLHHGTPRFDAIILGTGSDGHTASIFPDAPHLLTDKRPYAVSRHPLIGQKRITMTGTLILNAAALLLPAIGAGKSDILRRLLDDTPARSTLPAGYIISHARHISIYTDSLQKPQR